MIQIHYNPVKISKILKADSLFTLFFFESTHKHFSKNLIFFKVAEFDDFDELEDEDTIEGMIFDLYGDFLLFWNSGTFQSDSNIKVIY